MLILGDYPNPGIMLAHYLFFIHWISHLTVFCIACLFAKFTFWQHNTMANESDGTKVQKLARISTFLVPSLSWFSTKYQYYFCLNLLFLNFTTLPTSIAYFYSLLNSGCSLLRMVEKMLYNSNIFLTEASDFRLIRQWQLTFFVFNLISFIFKVFLDLAYPNIQDSFVLPFMFGVFLSQVVFSICKTYLEIFVHLDKILR